MTNDRAAQIANDRAKELAEKVKKGEDITKLAKAMQLDVTNSSMFGRVDSIDGLGPASTLEDAFSAPVGGVLGPLMIQGRNVVARVAEKADADMAALPVEHDTILQSLKQKKAQERVTLLQDGILAKLTSEGKVTVNRKEIQNLVATLRQK